MKCKYMVVSKKQQKPYTTISINNTSLEGVDRILYVESTMDGDRNHSVEIKHQLELEGNAFT